MSIKKKIALFTCFYSFNSIMFSQCSYSMDSNYYSFNNYCQVLQKHYNPNETKIIRKLSHNCFVFEYEGTNFVLKPMNCPGSFQSESLACERFKNKKYSLISPPINCFCDELLSSDEKMFSIYRYEQNISDQKLFNFINYSDYYKSNPSKIRGFAERKEIWNDIVNKIITIINILWKNKLIHNDMHIKNLMFSINDNKLDIKLIDFDCCCDHDQFISGDVKENTVATSWMVVFQKLIPSLCDIFLGKQYYASDGIKLSQLNVDSETKEFFGKILKIMNSLYIESSQRKGSLFNLNVYKFFSDQLPNILLNAQYNESEFQNTFTQFREQAFCKLYNKDIKTIKADHDYKKFINFINYIE